MASMLNRILGVLGRSAVQVLSDKRSSEPSGISRKQPPHSPAPAPSLPAAACRAPWRLPWVLSSFKCSNTPVGSLARLRAVAPSLNW